MSNNFVKHFHKKDLEKVFKAFSGGIPRYYELYLNKNTNKEDANQIMDSFFETWNRYSIEIIDAVTAEIVRYINYYKVEPKNGVDEFKLIYFMGMRLSAFLERDGHVLTSKIMLYATVLMLDERLKKYTNNRGRPELKDRLVKLIKDGKTNEKLGTDGIYLVYKCLVNVLKDLST